MWELSAVKIRNIADNADSINGSPVFTVNGKYTSRGWTEWTQGFQFGSAILQFDATDDSAYLDIGRSMTKDFMAPHVSHVGVHDHGFNNISTYGNLLRLVNENKVVATEWERDYYILALKISGAVQALRWTPIQGGGFIHSFNGAHSLFVDTIRSLRSVLVSYSLGHTLQAEGDRKINLLERAIQHLKSTAQYSVFYGEGRDAYDVRGRTAHECIFNVKDGAYRCPNSQQGYSPFSTWTRGLAWAMCGFAELIEWVDQCDKDRLSEVADPAELVSIILKGATATCDFYISNTPTDGIPYWDTGAPLLGQIKNYLDKRADPYNEFEPVDSSAAAIASQGLLRLGNYYNRKGDHAAGEKYWQAGLTVLNTLLDEPYLSTDHNHDGLLLHSIYHRPNGWDHISKGSKIPNGESSMWGDYHLREVGLYMGRIIRNEKYYSFFDCVP